MKYLKNIDKFKESLVEETNSIRLIENVNYHKTSVKNLGEVILPDPNTGDFKLSVMPFENKWFLGLFTRRIQTMGRIFQ